MDNIEILTNQEVTTKNLDHLGLIAGMCDEIGLVSTIDQEAGQQAFNKSLTYGEVVKCMILNGLGFVGRTLYLYSEYFEDKPLDLLFEKDLDSKQIDNNVLGRTLDKLFEIGVNELFTKIALSAINTLGIEVRSLHLDSTSFHVDGEYTVSEEDDVERIGIVKGYTRDHRPDLKQVILQLITSNEGNIPIFMAAASGNTDDKTGFETIVKKHLGSLREAVENRYLVGDSALYVPKTISLIAKEGFFVTRVPGTIKKGAELIENISKDEMFKLDDGYKVIEYKSDYAEIPQRWLVFFSQKAFAREERTFEKNYKKWSENERKNFYKLCMRDFACKEDAQKSLDKFEKTLKYTTLNSRTIEKSPVYSKKGRPKKGENPDSYKYFIKAIISNCDTKKEKLLSKKGFFVLSTNDLENVNFKPDQVLKIYKSQQCVERGFRFLKSPEFLVSALFLKKPERIEALLMVMTICLLVYSAIEHKAREALKVNDCYFPTQLKKPGQRPTARWIFYCFLGIHILYLNSCKKMVTNLRERHKTILYCLGPPYQKFYCQNKWRDKKQQATNC